MWVLMLCGLLVAFFAVREEAQWFMRQATWWERREAWAFREAEAFLRWKQEHV